MILIASAWPLAAQAEEMLRGRVIDMRTGQPIHKALVTAGDASATTDGFGRFELPRVGARPSVELTVTAVGYGVIRRPIGASTGELEIRLGQDAVKYAEAVDVSVSVFETKRDEPLAQSLDSVELRNLSSVVADDALRSVQALPGVAASDDFYASFSLRGWGFEKTGLYIDGVLISSPFHTIRGINDAYSLTILNNDMIEGVTLLNGGAPAAYGDRVGGTLRIETREGSRDKTTVRASLGAAGVSFVAEGPLGGPKTSWLLGARKSFLDYVVQALDDQPSFVVGYHDVQAKVSHRFGAGSLSLFLLAGDSTYRDEEPGQRRNDVARASADTRLASLRWRYTPSPQTSLTMSAFFTRETGVNRNLQSEGLLDSTSNQAGGRLDLIRGIGDAHTLQAGLLARHLSGTVADTTYPRSGPALNRDVFDESQWQSGVYLQDTWRSSSGRLTLTAGMRTDRSTALDRTVALPRLSGALRLGKDTALSFAGGGYAQFPALDQLYGIGGNVALLAERSDHYQVSLEHAFSSTTRVRVDVYDQEERDRLAPVEEIRRVSGQLVLPGEGVLKNAWSGRSEGLEVTLQRRSPNGLTGWLSYGLGRTRITDGRTSETFNSDHDQRHTVNAYLSYRISHRTNLSAKFRFGSNTPVVGYFEETATGHRVSDRRNVVRVPAYSRLDVRANRTFNIKKARLTLYAEIMNVLNHENYRYAGTSILIPSGQVFFDRETTFPFLPAAGITVEW
jgi:outer membrane cobalamin receptor